MSLNAKELYRFHGFELDPFRRVLSRDGGPVSLTPKAFDVLAYLVLNPGRVVTKDELLKAVWPDSFVEEGNLAQYVSALRKTLGDKSCLIATVPGRGYQFAAQVFATRVLTEEAQTEIPVNALPDARPGDIFVQRVRERTRVVIEDVPAVSTAPRETLLQLAAGTTSRRTRAWRWVAAPAIGGTLIALTCAYSWKHFAHPPQLSDVVVADFTNTTRDPTFDSTLNQALEIDLEQSPFLNLLSRSKIKETLALMQRRGDEALTPELAREICERNNAHAILYGTIANFGSKFLLTLAADSCADGRQVAAYKEVANSKDEILGALDAAAASVRRRLGESAASLQRFQTPITQATTPSLDALRAYSQGMESERRGDMKTAAYLFERAIALDPGFASAYMALGSSYYNVSDRAQAAEFSKKAFDLRERATERERLMIEIAYYYMGNYDMEAAVRSLKLFAQIYPNSSATYGRLCSLYTRIGQYNQAIDAGEQALRMDPHSGYNSEVLARAYLHANRFADAKRVASAAVADGRGRWGIHSILFQVACAEHDAAQAKMEGEWGLTHQQGNLSLANLALDAVTRGKLREGSDYFSRARAESLRSGDGEFADSTLLDRAEVLTELGDTGRAAATLKQIKGDAGRPGDLAFLQARLGDSGLAQRFVDSSNSLTEKNTFHIYYDLPTVRAQLALRAHKPAEAVEVLEPARAYQLIDFRIPYLRAQSETAAGMLDSAAQDYRLILDNQGVDPLSPLYPLAHLGLARAYALASNKTGSRSEYEEFFACWADADANLPVLKQAHDEYSRLK
jgi:DNA-binding winged helix-turn-helix (wHTH) protein/tetratricopeptide (TPR) repeat protein